MKQSTKPNFNQISVNLSIVLIYKFCKNEIFIQPSGEPREQHIGDVRPKKVELQNFWKDRYTLAHFLENCQRDKN